ncbi:uncharacterized protein BP01DRAFT_12533 [Aspergillus saccharolyticus JOP 1030-1]|uniref:C2H2-type domain-containing protein n=1 Tax=Aspergillus saccharolyticus JOP 1030-1 TaxID=1450539 RepID=A0A318ZSC0_9EURO|nr:hypothetical protein BP01DRAFT_12533 [Aspergillus saccharolyticus JOP 1030-1]PYH50017.1 hypothetical protein BP01DRAFT_12533 [Aspergillus saccharolyticus JOP 1030-1]
MTESYDPDEMPGSPGLKVTRVDYSLKDSPPPFGKPPPEGDDPKHAVDDVAPFSGSSRKRLPESPKPRTLEGNSVLIRHLEPNRPDIANFEYTQGFSHEADSEESHDKITKLKSKFENALPPDQFKSTDSDNLKAVDAAKQALDLFKEDPRENVQFGSTPKEPNQSPEQPSPKQEQQHTPANISSLLSDPPPPQRKHIEQHDSDTRLKNLLFFNPATSPGQVLPALHSTLTGNAVDHSLPSLQTALAAVSDVPPNPAVRINSSTSYTLPPVQASSPVSRADTLWDHQRMGQFGPPPQVPPSPYSHLSPASSKELSTMPSPASQSPYWRVKEIPYLASPYEVAPSTVKSPATSYPTPTDQTPTGTCDRQFNPPAHTNGPVTAGTYKCRHPGCTAPPFQTQYLLNSHANVHSQDRPHFCPIEGCPRGPGGKGFKRKNEMIRHGLVHNSPGYVCPFCPDQQHKYPRPDNLQRHVRVHHVDKNKDDPALRQVLAQRPEGSNRGRRRRTNPQ